MYQDFRYFKKKIQNFIRTLCTSIHTTNGINFLSSWALGPKSLYLYLYKDTENCLDILFGNILYRNLFPPPNFYPLKTPPEQFLLPKKCKNVWGKLKKHPLIEKN